MFTLSVVKFLDKITGKSKKNKGDESKGRMEDEKFGEVD